MTVSDVIPAVVDAGVGGEFSAWDGYIFGKILELTLNERIVQSWRISECPKGAPDSHMEVDFEDVSRGTRITLTHSNMSAGHVDSHWQGWEDFYFKPMKEFFSIKNP